MLTHTQLTAATAEFIFVCGQGAGVLGAIAAVGLMAFAAVVLWYVTLMKLVQGLGLSVAIASYVYRVRFYRLWYELGHDPWDGQQGRCLACQVEADRERRRKPRAPMPMANRQLDREEHDA